MVCHEELVINITHVRTHTHTRLLFYESLDFLRDYPGKLMPVR